MIQLQIKLKKKSLFDIYEISSKSIEERLFLISEKNYANKV